MPFFESDGLNIYYEIEGSGPEVCYGMFRLPV